MNFSILILQLPILIFLVIVVICFLLLSEERSLYPSASQNLFGTFRLYMKGMKPKVMNLSQVSENSHFLSKHSFFLIEVYLIYDIVLVSGVWQSDSVIYLYE